MFFTLLVDVIVAKKNFKKTADTSRNKVPGWLVRTRRSIFTPENQTPYVLFIPLADSVIVF